MAELIRVAAEDGTRIAAAYQAGITRAAAIINGGGLVAFPTETVYGLAADGLNPSAVAKVYAVKERPLDSALILHLADATDADRLVNVVPPQAELLMAAFWPGPLTLVLRKSPIVPDITTGGGESVGLRVPDHPVARDFIRAAGRPVVGPSANLSGRPSPMTAAHVLDELSGRIDAVLDAGPTHLGIESTVLDLTASPPAVLRLGSITPEQLTACLGFPVDTPQAGGHRPPPAGRGLRFRLVVVEGPAGPATDDLALREARAAASSGERAALLAQEGALHLQSEIPVVSLGPGGDLVSAAAAFYPALRHCELAGYTVVYAPALERTGLGLAIMHRLTKLAAEVVGF